MEHRNAARGDNDFLRGWRESRTRNADCVLSEGYGIELEFAIGIGGRRLAPVRIPGGEGDVGALDRAMLRVVDDAAHRPEDAGERECGQDEADKQNQSGASHGCPSSPPASVAGR